MFLPSRCIVMRVSVVMGVCIGVRVIWCVNVKEREYFCVVFSSLQTVSVSVSMRARAYMCVHVREWFVSPLCELEWLLWCAFVGVLAHLS